MRPLLFSFCFLLFISSCRKDTPNVAAGQVRVLITVMHHSHTIGGAVIFRKKGTLIFPGTDTTQYDDRFVADSSGKFTLSGVPNGYQTMILYAKGTDITWDSTHHTNVWNPR